MLDFDVSFRWLRIFYIIVLAVFIFLAAATFPQWPWIPALISLLAIVDITIDKEIYNVYDNDLEIDEEETNNERGYGPES